MAFVLEDTFLRCFVIFQYGLFYVKKINFKYMTALKRLNSKKFIQTVTMLLCFLQSNTGASGWRQAFSDRVSVMANDRFVYKIL